MSQGGPAPPPSSRPSSQSPATDTTTSPQHRQQHLGQQDAPRTQSSHNPSGATVVEGNERGWQPGNRPSGVHNILNPAGSQPAPAEGSPQPTMGPTPQYGTTQGSPSRPYTIPGQSGASTPRATHAQTHPTASPAGGSSSAERGSPSSVHPYPFTARRILTPKSPRVASLSRAALRTVEPQLANLPAPTPRTSSQTNDLSMLIGPPLGAPSPYPGSHAPTRPTSGLSRSLSQPSLSHGHPMAHPRELAHPAPLKREHSGQPVFPGSPYGTPTMSSRGLPASNPHGDGRWGPGPMGTLPPAGSATRSLQISEGQTLLTITPRHGEEIVVPVDVHQASKQADEKRQRNAGASARFRQRKKEREREQQQGLQKLESRNRELERKADELEKRCQELQIERDHYRNDRNRLRDIVARTAGISEWAEGPPSPSTSRVPAPYPTAGDSRSHTPHQQPMPVSHAHSQSHSHPYPHPHPAAHPLQHPHPHPHVRPSAYGEPSMLEPPLRRRRTDSEPQMPTSSFALSTPTTLPPIAGASAFGIPPSPHITPPPGPSRLPPLRFEPQPGGTSSTTPSPAPSGPPSLPPTLPPSLPPQAITPYPPQYHRKSSYETAGWATEPRPSEGGPR
ncbi:uncharacterized protein QC763_701890 [Podospora pseudopauciseta]|uniref:BZIP domain-containing protein n=1 Tax=Podospora pseudopauciseta TaxID=2093780 RepID=A0ABR0H0P5_9PEZI|nr:hypothetical protein QC763_701890 [Podospora pseudopauciseta]